MLSISTDPKNISNVLNKIAEEKAKIDKAVKRQVFASAEKIVKDAKLAAPVGADTFLRNSIREEIINDGFSAVIGTNLLKDHPGVFTKSYAYWVEFGRKAGKMPPWGIWQGKETALLRWVRLKLGAVSKVKNKFGFSKKFQKQSDSLSLSLSK